MSVSKRKIGLYSLEFVNKKTKSKLTGSELVEYFNSLIQYIHAKKFEKRKEEIGSSNKFYFLSYHNIKKENFDAYLKGEVISLIFESAKVGHCPDLIDGGTGTKRKSPKNYNEGEDEITHLAVKYKNDEAMLALEERKVGVTIGQIIKYLNKYILELPTDNQCDVSYNIIPYDGFLENLAKFGKIQVGTIYINQQVIGSEYLTAAQFRESVRDTVEVSFKALSRKSIMPGLIKQWYASMTGVTKKIDRIRLEGQSLDGAKIRLDTQSLQLIKHIDIKILQDTGIVESEDMFNHLDTLVKDL